MTDEFDALFAEPMRSGPAVGVFDIETGKVQRADHRRLKSYVDGIRVANIVCRRREEKVVAIVLGRSPKYAIGVTTTEGTLETMGDDILVSCRCGWDHVLIGGRLIDALAGLPLKRRSVPRFFVDTLERI